MWRHLWLCYAVLAAAQACEWDECVPEDDTVLLQVGVRLFPVNSSEISPVFAPGNVSLFTQDVTLRRSVLESGVKFGPKTSAALFLLLSCTFGFACLCGNHKPFITAPMLGTKRGMIFLLRRTHLPGILTN
eukprot:Skav203440  [mRNA]  locus=scaffold1836:289727:292335:- [translate_table: standard]